jgi:hypothetical protein
MHWYVTNVTLGASVIVVHAIDFFLCSTNDFDLPFEYKMILICQFVLI